MNITNVIRRWKEHCRLNGYNSFRGFMEKHFELIHENHKCGSGRGDGDQYGDHFGSLSVECFSMN